MTTRSGTFDVASSRRPGSSNTKNTDAHNNRRKQKRPTRRRGGAPRVDVADSANAPSSMQPAATRTERGRLLSDVRSQSLKGMVSGMGDDSIATRPGYGNLNENRRDKSERACRRGLSTRLARSFSPAGGDMSSDAV
jgi:hypothetical protein